MKSKVLENITVDPKEEEKQYRHNTYKDVRSVLNVRTYCTCCLNDVKDDILVKGKIYVHPFFQVLMCKECLKFYGDGYISPDDDGSDKYCRWCGQGGCLYVCSKCPVAICKICIKRNMSRTVRKDVERDDWECFSCKPQPLYELRAIAWAVKKCLRKEIKDKKQPKPVQGHSTINSIPGHLKNGYEYMCGIIKELQKSSRSFEMKIGPIMRRKDFENDNFPIEKLNTAVNDVLTRANANAAAIKKHSEDLESFIQALNKAVEKLKSENNLSENSNNVTVDLEESDHDNAVDDALSVTSNNNCDKDETDTNSKNSENETIANNQYEILKNSDESNSKVDDGDEEKPLPKFRIRKIEEVNKVLLQEKVNEIECDEIIDLDDDEEDTEVQDNLNSKENSNTSKRSTRSSRNIDDNRENSSCKNGQSDSDEECNSKAENKSKKEKNVDSDTECKIDNLEENQKYKTRNMRSRGRKHQKDEEDGENKKKVNHNVDSNEDKEEELPSNEDGKKKSLKGKNNDKNKEDINNKSKKVNNKGKLSVDSNETEDENQEEISRKSSRGKKNEESKEEKSKSKGKNKKGEKEEKIPVDSDMDVDEDKTTNSAEKFEENDEPISLKEKKNKGDENKKADDFDMEVNEENKKDNNKLRSLRGKKDDNSSDKNKSKKGKSKETKMFTSSEDEAMEMKENTLDKLDKLEETSKKENVDAVKTKNNGAKKGAKEDGDKDGNQAEKSKQVASRSDKMEVNSSASGDMFSDNDVLVTNVVSSTSTNSDEDLAVPKKKKKTEAKPEERNKRTVRKTRQQRDSLRKKKDIYSDSDSLDDIEKLLNIDNLVKGRKERQKKSLNDSENEMPLIRKERIKQEKEPDSKREKQKSILDYYKDESDESVIDVEAEIMTLRSAFNAKGGLEKHNEILKKINSKTAVKMEIEFSDSQYSGSDLKEEDKSEEDTDDLLKDSDEERMAKRKNKSKKERTDSDSGSSWGNKGNKAKTKDKLLSGKLSDSDSEASVFKNKNGKTTNKRGKSKLIVLSDSDEPGNKKKTRNSSESAGSDEEEEEKPKSNKRKRIKAMDSSDENKDDVEGSANKGRKNIKKILKKDSLAEGTQSALKEEEERKKRIAERQKLYNMMLESCQIQSSKVDKLVLDFDEKTKEELLSVDKDLVAKLKPHQAEGIKFMWDSCFETLKKAKDSKGSGCILAHCMGLGKTLQVVTLVHTLLSNEIVKTALVLCPLSTVLNWVNEFEKWLSDIGSGNDVDVFHLTKINAQYRAAQLREWQRRGGVMIMGYNLFRLLVNPAKRLKPRIRDAYLETLTDPGSDIVICDEGHLLKNEKTALSKAVEKIKTLRRVVLTGTPLQNNLSEYYCMMQFVKPMLLGTKKEFTNRFVNPIENGQFVDSTPQDVKIMKRRAHVLHKMLDGLVQRKAYNVLIPYLPTKHEYVLYLGLTEIQVKLYQYYLDHFSRNQNTATGAGACLFKDKNMLCLICAHPKLLVVQKENELLKQEESDEEGSMKDFVVDSTSSSSSSESESNSNSSNSDSDCMVSKKRRTRAAGPPLRAEEEEKKPEEEEEQHWWESIAGEADMEDIGSSTKLHLFFTILQKCEEIGDKILLFSQSLLVLDLIEYFLDKIHTATEVNDMPEGLRGFSGVWIKGLDYFRLDGRTSSDMRSSWCNKFNSDVNHRARLFLISTRAGGLGINLTGANRVILFDASWNPSHDVQSIFRVYRFGQDKPCYIYRFLNKGTIEQKVYDRQVTKLSMSCRVIDEQQIDRHFSYSDLNELYSFTPNEKDDKTPALPKDRLLAELLQEHKEALLGYHTHDSLLENQEDEELNEEERKQAWIDFENDKKPQVQFFGNNNVNTFAQTFQRVYTHLREKFPTWTDDDVQKGTRQVLSRMNIINPLQQQAQPQAGFPTGQQNPVLQMQSTLRSIAPMQANPRAMLQQQFNNMQQKQMYSMQQQIQQQYRNVLPRQGTPMNFNRAMPSIAPGTSSGFTNPRGSNQGTLRNPYAVGGGLPNPFNPTAAASLPNPFNANAVQLLNTSEANLAPSSTEKSSEP